MILTQNFKHLCTTLLEKQPWHYYKRKNKQEAATLCTQLVLKFTQVLCILVVSLHTASALFYVLCGKSANLGQA